MKEKVIIVSAPSGSGKSTVVSHLLSKFNELEFSVSATSRAPRGEEKHGKEYYFLTRDEFLSKIANNDFVEYEEVYSGSFYGTLKSELERIWKKDHIIIFDVDVKGGVSLKKIFKEQALSIFIKAPSIRELRKRLVLRGTDTPEAIENRVEKAKKEVRYAPKFDVTLVNDDLHKCLDEADAIIEAFLKK